MIPDLSTCIICHKINTTWRNENNEPICAGCSNEQYDIAIQSGEIVVLKIDMRKVKQSTLMQIQSLIQKDIEDAARKA